MLGLAGSTPPPSPARLWDQRFWALSARALSLPLWPFPPGSSGPCGSSRLLRGVWGSFLGGRLAVGTGAPRQLVLGP